MESTTGLRVWDRECKSDWTMKWKLGACNGFMVYGLGLLVVRRECRNGKMATAIRFWVSGLVYRVREWKRKWTDKFILRGVIYGML